MNNECIDLVIRFEGYSSKPYKCAAGVWTIGYGTTRYPSGRRVKSGDADCTKSQAKEWLTHELQKCEHYVLSYTTTPLNSNKIAALSSFVYNLGAGAFRASTLRKRINTGEFDDVPRQFMRWNKAGGRILRGLTRRRQAEVDLWLKSCY